MKTAFKPMLRYFLRNWIFYTGAFQIINAILFMVTGREGIEGPIWQIVYPAILVPVAAWIPRYDRWLDSKLGDQKTRVSESS